MWDYYDVAVAYWRGEMVVIRRERDGQEFEFPKERTVTSCLRELGLDLVPELIVQLPLFREGE